MSGRESASRIHAICSPGTKHSRVSSSALATPPLADVLTQREEKHQPYLSPSPISPFHSIYFPFRPLTTEMPIIHLAFPKVLSDLSSFSAHTTLLFTCETLFLSMHFFSPSPFIACTPPHPLMTELAADKKAEFSDLFGFHAQASAEQYQWTGEINLSLVLNMTDVILIQL